MFFSETLLAKGSSLASVWLAANLERKLTRREFINADIAESARAITSQDDGPMSLRLSGQLLLGVVRIYGRKARYLMDDCNDAFMKLRMVFKPGNVDMPTNHGMTNKGSNLILSNTITDLDMLLPELPPELEADIFQTQPNFHDDDNYSVAGSTTATPSKIRTSRLKDITLPSFDKSIEVGRGASVAADDVLGNNEDEDDFDLGLDLDEDEQDKEVEVGRGIEGDGLDELPVGVDDELPIIPDGGNDEYDNGGVDLLNQGGFDDQEFGNDNMEMPSSPDLEHPLTPTRDADILRDAVNVADGDNNLEGRQQALSQEKRKRTSTKTGQRKLTNFDGTTELSKGEINRMNNDRSAILQRHPLLPEDPERYALFQLSNDHEKFTSSIYCQSTHTYLNRLLDPNFVRQVMMSSRPERREQQEQEEYDDQGMDMIGGSYDEEEEEERPSPSKHPRAENSDIVEGDHEYVQQMDDFGGPDLLNGGGEDYYNDEVNDNVDNIVLEEEPEPEVEEPGLPNKNGISQNTIRAAKTLVRELPTTNDMIEFSTLTERSDKRDKVKMFFEVLVLATKDAIVVDQREPYQDIIISSKESLYGPVWQQDEVEA